MYGPVYRPYRSVFYFSYYPRYYRPWTPVRIHVYRTRTVHYTTRRNFTVVRTSRVSVGDQGRLQAQLIPSGQKGSRHEDAHFDLRRADQCDQGR